MTTILGSNKDDVLNGTPQDDTFLAGDGQDLLDGGDGDDWLDGGPGIDRMFGGKGNDTYKVDNPFDVVRDVALLGGIDTVLAWSSYTLGATSNVENLTLMGDGANRGDGNWMDNLIIGNDAANVLHGGDGNDTLRGEAGADNLWGDGGDDKLYGSEGDDRLEGGAGNDLLVGGSGADRMDGGPGDDTYIIDNLFDVATEFGVGGGVDLVQSTVSILGLGAGIENLTLLTSLDLDATGNALDNRINGNAGDNKLYGGRGEDTLFGGEGHDHLEGGDNDDALFGGDQDDELLGGSGADTLWGGDGDDHLDGGSGTDQMYGGLGDDDYYVGNAKDVVIDVDNGGHDRVFSSASNYTLDANGFIEDLLLSGGAFGGTGNALANYIVGTDFGNQLEGSGGDDNLDGGGGSDYLYGGPGNDTLIGGRGADQMSGGSSTFHRSDDHDTFVFFSAEEADGDHILDFRSGHDRIDLSGIDANDFTGGTNDSFHFIGDAPFSSDDATGQLRFDGGYLYGSTNADPLPEFVIWLSGGVDLVGVDLIL